MRSPRMRSRRTARADRESFEALRKPGIPRAYKALPRSVRDRDPQQPFAPGFAIDPAIEVDEDLLWFWIGSHAAYDRLTPRLEPYPAPPLKPVART
jgi:hypothetical protein